MTVCYYQATPASIASTGDLPKILLDIFLQKLKGIKAFLTQILVIKQFLNPTG